MPISLPMCGINRDDVETFWQGLRARLLARGWVNPPQRLCWPALLPAHWRDVPAL
ncbi:hypothetical protein [Acerihabitans arboris]|uniref:Uncharacterized protein n=1 Tax=Acerihabitans arboris TaxID=2691583 RepID=A0A845SLS9_9GAMM|nr:hypothetical protein [Acerihabitans arboris]NDL64949.1 hypothetical protein [Acerihabitans arboris]